MEEYFDEGDSTDSQDLSWQHLDEWPADILDHKSSHLKAIQISHNSLNYLPNNLGQYINLVSVDISNNALTNITDDILHLKKLKTLIARNNAIHQDGLPKDFGLMEMLEVINLNGNRLTEFPLQFTEMRCLKCLYLGSNRMRVLPPEIKNMARLEVFHVGGNNLSEIPTDIGYLRGLTFLNLCDNKLEHLPTSLINLRRLKSLMLHNNNLSVLPPEIVGLELMELSLRNNPLVVKFVRDMIFAPPSLLELAGRTIKTHHVRYFRGDLPDNLLDFLNSAHKCVNPKCKGVYFSSRWEHVKFVDFCGKYRLPLLQYLCSPSCTPNTPVVRCSSESESEEDIPIKKMKKVLLG